MQAHDLLLCMLKPQCHNNLMIVASTLNIKLEDMLLLIGQQLNSIVVQYSSVYQKLTQLKWIIQSQLAPSFVSVRDCSANDFRRI